MTDSVERMVATACRYVDAVKFGGFDGVEHPEHAAAVRAALSSLGLDLSVLAALKEGAWQVVPKVATDDMIAAMNNVVLSDGEIADEWRAALAAAPTRPGGDLS